MPEPTPTVIAITEQDRELARKWYRCGCGATYETIMESEPAARQRHHHHVADEVEAMASEIAAAREAWGVSREAVAGLVEAAENWTKARHAADCARYPNQTFQPWMWCECRLQALYDALKRVKPKARLWAHKGDD